MHVGIEGSKSVVYRRLAEDLDSLLAAETDAVANLANAAALAACRLDRISWVGFYLADGDGGLVLGPFQGKPACTRIGPGRGVCGAAACSKKTMVVADVRDFPGHIACDPESRSEIVVPISTAGGEIFGVLDVDSSVTARFDEEDAEGLDLFVAVLRRRLMLC